MSSYFKPGVKDDFSEERTSFSLFGFPPAGGRHAPSLTCPITGEASTVYSFDHCCSRYSEKSALIKNKNENRQLIMTALYYLELGNVRNLLDPYCFGLGFVCLFINQAPPSVLTHFSRFII